MPEADVNPEQLPEFAMDIPVVCAPINEPTFVNGLNL
jgi:hypothetical protein